MSEKNNSQYFDMISSKPFAEFMDEYTQTIHDFVLLLSKTMSSFESGKQVSKHHLFKMRQKTIDIQKFGKQFRERTILMEKEE